MEKKRNRKVGIHIFLSDRAAVAVRAAYTIPPRVSLKYSKLVHWTNLDCLKRSKEVQ